MIININNVVKPRSDFSISDISVCLDGDKCPRSARESEHRNRLSNSSSAQGNPGQSRVYSVGLN